MTEAKAEIESHIVLGYKCNNHCKHCVVQVKRGKVEDENVPDLSTEEALCAIDTAISNGATKIVLTGGEPTLRSDLPLLVEYCIDAGLFVQIQTNASITSKIRAVVELCANKKSKLEFMIPLHSSVMKEHDAICGESGCFSGAIASMELLTAYKIAIIGKIVLTRYTGDLSNICSIYENYNVLKVIIAYPHCVSFPDWLVRQIDLCDFETKKILNSFYRNEFAVSIQLQGFPRCFIGETKKALLQEEQQDYLSLKIVENKFRAGDGNSWHEYRKKDKRKFLHCKDCLYSTSCEGVWKEYIRVYGEQ